MMTIKIFSNIQMREIRQNIIKNEFSSNNQK